MNDAGASVLWSTFWAGGSIMGAVSFLLRFLSDEYCSNFYAWVRKWMQYFNSYILFEIPEFYGAGGNEIYDYVESYLSSNTALAAQHVKLYRPKNASHNTFSLGNYETLEDSSFMNTKVWWTHEISQRTQTGIQWNDTPNDEKRKYYLKIRKADKNRLLEPYVQHVIDTAKTVKEHTRDCLLYTNVSGNDGGFRFMNKAWESVPFKHPSTFETLAMDPDLKDEIKEDLLEFTKGKEFYEKAGKPWKRGYLLYGPPGTGKSSMIAAIANFLNYDIYDVELTEVGSNSELRKLLIQTSDRSIIVIEYIDCSVDLAERAKAKKEAKD
jgi:predicted AAA+ superfamily ATPase